MSEIEGVRQGDVGYLASLKRMFSPLKALATTVSVTSVMTGIVPLTQQALSAGGPVVMVFGFAFICAITSMIAMSLADISSGFPNVKGGLAEYSRRLAPPHLKRISSWTVGWLHFFAFTTAATSCSFAIALYITAGLEIAIGEGLGRWVTVLIHIVVSILFGVFNTFRPDIDLFSIVWHVLGPIVLIITVAASSKNPPSIGWVLGHFENQTGWSSPAYASLLGLMLGSFTLAGYDAPIHTLYNTENAATRVPRGILFGFLVAFVLGEVIILTLLFGISDIQLILNPVISGIASLEIFIHLVGKSGVAYLLVIFTVTFFLCGQGILRAVSEIGHELAESGAFPKSKFFSQVGSKGQPIRVGWLGVAVSCCIGILYLGNTTILQALTSAVVMELNLVYTTPVALRLFFPSPTRFQSGPFTLGRWSGPVAILACTWGATSTVIFSLPSAYPVTGENMNYASVLLVATLGVILGYWFFSARHWFDLGNGQLGDERKRSDMTATNEGETCIEVQRSASMAGRPNEPLPAQDLDEIENWLDNLERDLHQMN